MKQNRTYTSAMEKFVLRNGTIPETYFLGI